MQLTNTWIKPPENRMDVRMFNRLCLKYKIDKADMLDKIRTMQFLFDGRHISVRTMGNKKTTEHQIRPNQNKLLVCDCPNYVYKCRDKVLPCKHLLFVIVNALGNPAEWLGYIT